MAEEDTFSTKWFISGLFVCSTNFKILLSVSATHGSRIEKAFLFVFCNFIFLTKFAYSCLWKYLQLSIKLPYVCNSSIAMIVFNSAAQCGRSVTAWQVSLRIPEFTESLNEMHGLS